MSLLREEELEFVTMALLCRDFGQGDRVMNTEEEFLDKEILEDARSALDWNVTDSRAVYGCLRILLRGVLDRLLQEYDDE